MSRTFRFRKGYIPWFNSYEWEIWETITEKSDLSEYEEIRIRTWVSYINPVLKYEGKISSKSKRGKAILAKTRKDSTFRFKEPGPAWWRNLTHDRPLRRFMKNEIHKFMKDETYEVPHYSRLKLDYWT